MYHLHTPEALRFKFRATSAAPPSMRTIDRAGSMS
jgi:hypothetical protein